MRCRNEIDVFHDILCSLEEGEKGKWAIIANTNMNSKMWRKYRITMLNLGLITTQTTFKLDCLDFLAPLDDREVGEATKSVFEITPKGRKLLCVIREYRFLLTPEKE